MKWLVILLLIGCETQEMSEVFLGQDWLDITIDMGFDVTSATCTIQYEKPDGTSGEYSGTVQNTTEIFYAFTDGDIDKVGMWKFQGKAVAPDSRKSFSGIYTINFTKPISIVLPVIILSGQSNADGRAENQRAINVGYATEADRTPSNVWTFIKTATPASSNDDGTWELLDVSARDSGGNNIHISHQHLYGEEIHGLEFPLSRKLPAIFRAAGYYGEFLIIKMARGGTQIDPDPSIIDWHPTSLEIYQELTRYYDQGIAHAVADWPHREIKVIANIWWQGESDVSVGERDRYKQNLSQLISAFRAHDCLLKDLPWIDIRLYNSPGEGETTVNTAKDELAAADPNMYQVDAAIGTRKQDLTVPEQQGVTGYLDDLHHSYISMELIADEIATIIQNDLL
jgi:hypothetical protein